MGREMLAVWMLAPALLGAVAGIVLDAFSSRTWALSAVLAGLGISTAAGAWASSALLGAPFVGGAAWGVLRVGSLSATLATAIFGLAVLAVLGGWSVLSKREWGGTIGALMAFGAAASWVVASSVDVTLLLIALETAAACAYALVAAGRGSRSREAAMKYFIQGSIATAFFVFGMAVLVTVFIPSGDMRGLAQALGGDVARSVGTAGVVLLISALAFKIGAAPFHSWAPDAYESASPESAAFLASGPKLGALAALAVLGALTIPGSLLVALSTATALLGVASVLVGSVAALGQRSYTRMLGYAGVAQVGYALIAIATLHEPSVPVFFTACYALAATGTFLSAAAFRRIRPEWDGSIASLSGIAREAPALALSTSLLLISLAGIPPLLGFWAKFAVFAGALAAAVSAFSGQAPAALGWVYAGSAVVGIIGSVVSLGYYGNVLRVLYEAPASAIGSTVSGSPDQPDDGGPIGPDSDEADAVSRIAGGTATVAVVIIATFVVVLGLVPIWSGIGRLLVFFAVP